MTISSLPALNAALNALAAILLAGGFVLIRRGRVRAHRFCMISAFIVSSLFLISYVVYHYHVGDVRFRGTGWVRPAYFSMLASHVTLAAAIVPLAIITLARALRGRFHAHRRIARWTWPIWMYVSVTGVLVYVMVYHLYRAPADAGAGSPAQVSQVEHGRHRRVVFPAGLRPELASRRPLQHVGSRPLP